MRAPVGTAITSVAVEREPKIAERLIVGRSTIKFHVSSIPGKLGAASRTEAVALAVRHRFVAPRE